MTPRPLFHAEKPILTTHPVNGGDALVFAIRPPPPRSWWRVMRNHAGANPLLIRPWDQQHEGRIAVVCPSLEKVTEVIDAINAAVHETNNDYERELERRRESSEQLKTVEAEHDRYLSDVRRAIAERYPNTKPAPRTTVVLGRSRPSDDGQAASDAAAAAFDELREAIRVR